MRVLSPEVVAFHDPRGVESLVHTSEGWEVGGDDLFFRRVKKRVIREEVVRDIEEMAAAVAFLRDVVGVLDEAAERQMAPGARRSERLLRSLSDRRWPAISR